MKTPEILSGELDPQGESDLTSEKRKEGIIFVKESLNRIKHKLRDWDIRLLDSYLCGPFFAMGLQIGSGASLGSSVRGVRAGVILILFGKRGREWLERTGKDKYLSETTGIQHGQEDRKFFEAVGILTAPVSAELKDRDKDLQNVSFLQGSSRSTPALPSGENEIVSFPRSLQRRDSNLTLPPSAQEELAKRMESTIVVFKEFADPARRERERSDLLRIRIINQLREIYNHSHQCSNLPTLDVERSLAVYLLTRFSEQELAPNVLNEMVASLGDFIEIWIDRFLEHRRRKGIAYSANLERAIKTEYMTHGRVDTPFTKKEEDDFSDNFSPSEALQMSKSLVAICFRWIPESKKTASVKTRFLVEKMEHSEPELKTKRFGVSTDGIQEWDKIKRVLSLPRLLPREIGQPLQQYLDAGYDVEPKINFENGEVSVLLKHNASLRDLRKVFAWAALHFPETKRIIVKFGELPENVSGGRPSIQEEEMIPIQECAKNTDQAYEEDLLSLAGTTSSNPYGSNDKHDIFLRPAV